MVANLPSKLDFRYSVHPATGNPARVLSSFGSVRQHVEDHMLTAPEAHAWSLAVPGIARLVDCSCPDALYEAARALGSPELLQGFYDMYAGLVDLALAEARIMGWWVATGDGEVHAVGLSGLLVALQDDVVRTGFFPGFGSARAVQAGKAHERGRLLRRQRAAVPRVAIPDRRYPREQRVQERRMRAWSPEERLFHGVVDPSLRQIRSWTGSPAPGTPGARNHIASYCRLKTVLPPRRRLRFEDWLKRRECCDICIRQGLRLS